LRGEVALGGFSLRDSAPREEEVATGDVALVVLLLLKTCPPAESTSSSEGTSTTLVKGGWFSGSLSQGKRNSCNRSR